MLERNSGKIWGQEKAALVPALVLARFTLQQPPGGRVAQFTPVSAWRDSRDLLTPGSGQGWRKAMAESHGLGKKTGFR